MLAREHIPVMTTMAKHPATGQLTAKMNGIVEFAPWGWWIGTDFFLDDIDATFWRTGRVLLALIIAAVAGIGDVRPFRIRRKSQQNAAFVEEAAAVADSLSGQAHRHSQAVSIFRT